MQGGAAGGGGDKPHPGIGRGRGATGGGGSTGGSGRRAGGAADDGEATGGGGWTSTGGGNRQGGGRVDGEETDGLTLEERITFAKEKALGQFLNTPESQTQVFWLLVTMVDGEPWAQVYYFKNLTWAQLEARETANAIGDWVQAGLSIAGMVPGVGDVADGINAGISFFRALADGNSLGDALGVGAMTLGAGMLPLGMGALKNLGKVADTLKAVKIAGKPGRHGAFRAAKRQHDIDMSKRPECVVRVGTKAGDAAGLRKGVNLRQYEFKNRSGKEILIREDLPVTYPDGGSQRAHFNSGGKNETKLRGHHYFEK